MAYDLGMTVAVGAIVGISAALLGIFIVLYRLSLAGDALSHVALPGIGIALALGINQTLGAVVFLFVGAVSIILIERYTTLPIDAIVGVFFTTSLALGALVSPSAEELLESLFGDINKLTVFDAVLGLVLGTGVIVITLIKFKDFTRLTLSADFAQSEGQSVESSEFALLMLLTVMIVIGIKIVGILLLGALIIVPPASAKNIGSSMRSVSVLAVIFGVLAVIIGMSAASYARLAPGPLVVIANAAIFLVSLIFRRT